jgi:hypothetical protein
METDMGQKYAAYDKNGVIVAFYDSTDSPVPEGVEAIALSHDEWQACLAVQGGWTVNDDKLSPPSPEFLLSQARGAQKRTITASYNSAVVSDISFTTEGGVTKKFEADAESAASVARAAQSYSILGETPSGFYWISSDNTPVPFTLKDIQGLNAAITAQGWEAFQTRSKLKAKLASAKDIDEIMSIKWS